MPERLAHAANYQFGRICEVLITGIHQAVLQGDTELMPIEFPLPVPDWLVVQPIVTLKGESAVGRLLQQHPAHVEQFSQAAAATEVEVQGQERLQAVAAATFRFQTELMRGAGELVASSQKAFTFAQGMRDIFSQLNELRAVQVERGLLQRGAPDQATILFKEAMKAAKGAG